METYKALIRDAIATLPEHDGAARRAVYEKARSALVQQLRALDPPLQAAEIKRSRLLLEETIHQVEREFAAMPAAQPSRDADKDGNKPAELAAFSSKQEVAATEGQVIETEYALVEPPEPEALRVVPIDIHERVRRAVLKLGQLLERDDEASSGLMEAVSDYRTSIVTEIETLDAIELWSAGGALANLLVASRALQVPGLEGRMPSQSSYRLEALVWEHGASLLGYPLMRRIMTIAETFVSDHNLAEQLNKLYPAAEAAIAPDAAPSPAAIGTDAPLLGKTPAPGASRKMQ